MRRGKWLSPGEMYLELEVSPTRQAPVQWQLHGRCRVSRSAVIKFVLKGINAALEASALAYDTGIVAQFPG